MSYKSKKQLNVVKKLLLFSNYKNNIYNACVKEVESYFDSNRCQRVLIITYNFFFNLEN